MLSHSRTSLILGGVVAARTDLGLSTVSITALAVIRKTSGWSLTSLSHRQASFISLSLQKMSFDVFGFSWISLALGTGLQYLSYF